MALIAPRTFHHKIVSCYTTAFSKGTIHGVLRQLVVLHPEVTSHHQMDLEVVVTEMVMVVPVAVVPAVVVTVALVTVVPVMAEIMKMMMEHCQEITHVMLTQKDNNVVHIVMIPM